MSLRPARSGDAPAIVAVFQAPRRVGLPYLPVLHTDAEDHPILAMRVAQGGVTVAEDRRRDGRVPRSPTVASSSTSTSLRTTSGAGSAPTLLSAAQAARPAGLQLWVFQRNAAAIAFDEARGFAIVESTDGTRNDEGEPDHRMALAYGGKWRRTHSALSGSRRYERPLIST